MIGEEIIAGEPSEQDPEVKRVVAMATTTSAAEVTLADRIEYFSSWFCSQKAVVLCIRYIRILKLRVEERKQPLCGKGLSPRRRNTDTTQLSLTVKELQYAATVVIKAAQATAFKNEIKVLSKTKEAQELQGRNQVSPHCRNLTLS